MATNLLDTFIIAFQGDSSGVQAEAEQGRAAAANMAGEIDKAGTAAQQSTTDIKDFLTVLAGAGAAAVATFSAAVAGLVAAQDKMAETGDFAGSIGAKTTDVSALEAMAVKAGGSVDGLHKALEKVKVGGSDAVSNLGEVAKAMEKLPQSGQIALGNELGLDRSMVEELAKGYDHYTKSVEASRAAMPYSERDFQQAHEVSMLWGQIKAGMEQTPPALTLLSVKLSGLLKEVLTIWRDFTQAPMSQGMIKTVEIAAIFLENMWKMIKLVGQGLGWVAKQLQDFLPLIAGIGAALVVALMPLQYLGFGALIAGVALLLLALDDLRAYFQGENSIFGEFLAEHPKVSAAFHEIGQVISKLGDAAGVVWDTIKDKAGELWEQLQALLPTTDDLSDGFATVTKFLEENKDTLLSVAKAAGTLLAMWLAYKAKAMLSEATDGGTLGYLIKMIGIIAMLTKAWNALGAAASKVWGVVKSAGEALGEKLGVGGGAAEEGPPPGSLEAVQQIAAANASPTNSVSSSAVTNSTQAVSKSTSVNIEKVEVQTQATDADGISKGISDGLSNHLRQASDHYDDGMAY
jgi:hypothetical protein